MKISICTVGSRGDIQPYLALAVGLQQAGHWVTLVIPSDFTEWIRSYGVNVHPMHLSFRELTQKQEVQTHLRGHNLVRQLQALRDAFAAFGAGVIDDCWEAAQAADFVVLNFTTCMCVDTLSQRDIPMALVSLQPLFTPTHAFPTFMLPFRFSLGGRYNYLTYALYLRAGWPLAGGVLNHWRTSRLGLPPWRSAREMLNTFRDCGMLWLYGYSPRVLPKPTDWEDSHHVTGYWFLDPQPNWQPPAELVRFLESGPPPVYVGFGSMSDKDPEHQTRLVLRALELAGQRGVLLTGWGAVARLPTSASVFYVDDVPHSWLFPRMAAVVHHGGAGTTAAGLRAGVPSLITPFLLDQYAWADRVAKLGIGLRLADHRRLTAEKLAQAIHSAVADSALRARAAAFGESIRAEDGVAHAAEVIERHAAGFSRSRENPEGTSLVYRS